jgi:hypothetical protein
MTLPCHVRQSLPKEARLTGRQGGCVDAENIGAPEKRAFCKRLIGNGPFRIQRGNKVSRGTGSAAFLFLPLLEMTQPRIVMIRSV